MTSMVDNHFHEWNADALAVVICTAISVYSALELELTLGLTFQSYRGLYFWSMVIASFGIIPYSIGFTIEYFQLYYLAFGIALDTAGWSAMITGQSLVLYSRLHLVFGNGHKNLLQLVGAMIVINGLVLHGTTSVIAFKANIGNGEQTAGFVRAYSIIEPTQMSIFAFQELVLSGLYIWKAVDMLKTSDRERSRSVMRQLFLINVIIIMLDIALLATEFSGKHVIQQTLKGVVYSVKLKLELAILNKLVELSKSSSRRNADVNTNDFVDPTIALDVTRFIMNVTRGNSKRKGPRWTKNFDTPIIGMPVPEDSSIQKSHHTPSVDEGDPDAIMPIAAQKSGRETVHASELMYADAIRRISVSK